MISLIVYGLHLAGRIAQVETEVPAQMYSRWNSANLKGWREPIGYPGKRVRLQACRAAD
jgi:hypothetical protein